MGGRAFCRHFEKCAWDFVRQIASTCCALFSRALMCLRWQEVVTGTYVTSGCSCLAALAGLQSVIGRCARACYKKHIQTNKRARMVLQLSKGYTSICIDMCHRAGMARPMLRSTCMYAWKSSRFLGGCLQTDIPPSPTQSGRRQARKLPCCLAAGYIHGVKCLANTWGGPDAATTAVACRQPNTHSLPQLSTCRRHAA